MSEVLVIGGGMAGAMAALSARKAGADVVLVRKAYGATALSSGAVDVAPDVNAPGGDLAAHLESPFEAAQELARVRPTHPYGVLKGSLARLPESLELAFAALGELLAPLGPKNRLLPTPMGTVKPCATAQLSQVGADVASLPGRVAVVELPLRPEFDARLVAQGISEAAAALRREIAVTVVRADALKSREDPLRTPFEIAAWFEQPAARAQLVAELRRAVPPGTQAVLLPPLFGRRGAGLAKLVGDELGIPCHESLSLLQSVPGLRLQEALDRALGRAQVRVEEAELRDVGYAGGPFELRPGLTVRPTAVVLATGKYIGGGIARDGHFFEPVFDLPVFAGDRALRDQFIGDLTSERAMDQHLAFRAGVRIDSSLRPLGVGGRPAHPRLFAAGAVLSGYDAASDKSGLGVAIFTGYLAGEMAAHVQPPAD